MLMELEIKNNGPSVGPVSFYFSKHPKGPYFNINVMNLATYGSYLF